MMTRAVSVLLTTHHYNDRNALETNCRDETEDHAPTVFNPAISAESCTKSVVESICAVSNSISFRVEMCSTRTQTRSASLWVVRPPQPSHHAPPLPMSIDDQAISLCHGQKVSSFRRWESRASLVRSNKASSLYSSRFWYVARSLSFRFRGGFGGMRQLVCP